MDRKRYTELSVDQELNLSKEELEEGWFFCHCEWDGLLIHKGDKEAEFCGCLKERQRMAETPEIFKGTRESLRNLGISK